METAKMSERGQIIIPKEVREKVHADTDTIFIVDTLDKNTIVMKKFDSHAWIKKFKEMRKRTAKLSSSQIEAEIHDYRRQKRSS